MVFPAIICDAHPLIAINLHIRSVKPPCGVSKSRRSQEFEKIIKTYSSFELRIAEDRAVRIEGGGIALI